MRKLGRYVLLFFMAWGLAGCGPGTKTGDNPGAPEGFPLTITDDAGRTVRIEKPPEKMASLSPSNTEILFVLGLGEKVVGVDDYSDYPPEASSKEKLGGFAKTNLEKVVSLGPDVILATNIHLKAVVPELEKRGFTVVVLQPEGLEGVLANIRLVGRIAGASQKAEEVVAGLEKQIRKIRDKVEKAPKVRVFLELDAKLTTVGPGTFVDDMIVKAGGENIAHDASVPWPQLSSEAIVLKDPQVILLADHGLGATSDSVRERPGWDRITAVREGRVLPLDPNLVNRPGPRAIEGLELTAKAIHPELFR